MDWIRRLRQAIDIVFFRQSAIRAVSADEDAFLPGLSFVALFGLIGSLQADPLKVATGTIAAVIGSFFTALLLYLLALAFGGRGRYLSLWQPIAFFSVINTLHLPLYLLHSLHYPLVRQTAMGLIYLFTMYKLILTVYILETVMGLRRGQAVLVVLIPFLLLPLLLMLLMMFMTEGSSFVPFLQEIF